MMNGFIRLDSQRFYLEIWPKIKDYVDSIKSNKEELKACKNAGLPAPTLVIYWGYKVEMTGEKIVVAVTQSCYGGPDEHWVSPDLMQPNWSASNH